MSTEKRTDMPPENHNKENVSKYELLLKHMLEQRGIKVIQQFPLKHPWGENHYDLCIEEWKLIIEADGWQHDTPENKKKDLWRRRTAKDEGYRMIRFTNKQIFDNPARTMEMIMRYKPGGPRGLDTIARR